MLMEILFDFPQTLFWLFSCKNIDIYNSFLDYQYCRKKWSKYTINQHEIIFYFI